MIDTRQKKRSRLNTKAHSGIIKESLPNLSDKDSASPPCFQEGTRPKAEYHKKNAAILSTIFDQSIDAKLWGVATKGLAQANVPKVFPEYTVPGGTSYVYRRHDFWTSGFFPGSLYLLLERKRKFAHILSPAAEDSPSIHLLHLEYACKLWTEQLHQNAFLNSTHDLGFMIMPWAKLAYELNSDHRAFETIKIAAKTLLTRYCNSVGCIRSWDRCVTKRYNFVDTATDTMVIIDNMMNLDLLFYVAAKTSNSEMYAAAIQHARTTTRTHIRQDGSTTHLVVFDPNTGHVKHRLTNQGYSHDSCWARGQSWAIAGFAETYAWTHEKEFLDTACRCADYFLAHLPSSGIVPWDFDAVVASNDPQPPDVSAAMIAAYGMILIHKGLSASENKSPYLKGAFRLIRAACTNHFNPMAKLILQEEHMETVEEGPVIEPILRVIMGQGDTILTGATINNYEHAPRRWANHGLVYADYYLLLVGNTLLEMGIGPREVEFFGPDI